MCWQRTSCDPGWALDRRSSVLPHALLRPSEAVARGADVIRSPRGRVIFRRLNEMWRVSRNKRSLREELVHGRARPLKRLCHLSGRQKGSVKEPRNNGSTVRCALSPPERALGSCNTWQRWNHTCLQGYGSKVTSSLCEAGSTLSVSLRHPACDRFRELSGVLPTSGRRNGARLQRSQLYLRLPVFIAPADRSQSFFTSSALAAHIHHEGTLVSRRICVGSTSFSGRAARTQLSKAFPAKEPR
jgi:hypothetical protein